MDELLGCRELFAIFSAWNSNINSCQVDANEFGAANIGCSDTRFVDGWSGLSHGDRTTIAGKLIPKANARSLGSQSQFDFVDPFDGIPADIADPAYRAMIGPDGRLVRQSMTYLLVPEIDYTLGQAAREGIAVHSDTVKWMNKGRGYGRIVSGYWQAGVLERLARVRLARTSHDARFLMPRLLGFRAFATLRQSIERWRGRSR